MPNGSTDNSFNSPSSSNFVSLESLQLQPDGKIIVGGSLTSLGGAARTGIGRLNTDGTVDNAFNPTLNGTHVKTFCINADGKIVIAGRFSQVNGGGRNSIARLNSNGSLDTTFSSPFSEGTAIYAMLQQTGGKLLVVYQDQTVANLSRMIRLNTDGKPDYTFTPVLFDGIPLSLASDSTNVYAIGSFSRVNTTVRNNITKIQAQVYTPTYTFNGTGNWSDSANWLGGQIPPNPVPAGSVVLVNPSTGGSCTFNGSLTISPGATLLIPPNVNFTVNGNIIYL